MMLRYLLLIVGVFACSTAVVFIKASETHPLLLSAWRLMVGAVVLTPVAVKHWRRHRADLSMTQVKLATLPGLVLALHFITWTIGARMTPAANGSLIVNLVPLAMPFLLFVILRERVNRLELAGTAVAIIGLGLLCFADFNTDLRYLAGDGVCFGSMLLFAVYLVLGRRNNRTPSLWLYVVPVYYVASLTCFAAALFVASPFQAYPIREILLLVALGVIPTVVGHSTLNWSMKRLRGQVVSVFTMGQFVFAGIMAWPLFGEIPVPMFYPASALLVIGAWLAIQGHAKAVGADMSG